MASRKRKPDSPQIGLSFAGPSLPPSEAYDDQTVACSPGSTGLDMRATVADSGSRGDVVGPRIDISIPHIAPAYGPEAGTNLDDFDDYDDAAMHDDVPRLRLVDLPREVIVIVEAVGDGFEVCRLRDNGTTCAAVMYTRRELEELIARAQSALEM